jgi:ketosteroid isomerase-like protein
MKNLSKSLLMLFLFTGMLFFSCQSNEGQQEHGPDLDQLRAELQEMENAFADSQNNKNTDGMMAYYSEDAQSLPANEPPIIGRSAILEQIQEDQASDTTGNQVRFEVVDVFADGNLVVETGKSISTDSDGNETYGKYMSLFERRNGKLVCIRDIYNDDAQKESASSN